MEKRQKKQLACAAGGLASLLLWLNRRLFLVNDITTGQTKEYPDLTPRAYPYPAAEVFALAEATARDLPRWRVSAVDRLGREIQAEAETTLFGLVDDITVRVDPIPGSAVSEVTVRSRARSRAGDLGENARRVRDFFKALDGRVQNAAGAEIADVRPISL